MAERRWGGEQYWLEGGWVEYYNWFGDHDQHVYTQQCDTVRDGGCDWLNYENTCGDAYHTAIYVAVQSDDLWDSFCWDFDLEEWVTMWANFDSGTDEADGLEALFEVREDQPGTVSMGTIRFYGLELKDDGSWEDWDDSYEDDTGALEEGGYTLTTNSDYDDFEVDD